MNRFCRFLCLLLIIYSCKLPSSSEVMYVNSEKELLNTIEKLKPGDIIILANGIYKDVQIKFRGKGTKDKPITLKAETAGKVSIEGQSYLKFGGEYLVVEGLHFKTVFRLLAQLSILK